VRAFREKFYDRCNKFQCSSIDPCKDTCSNICKKEISKTTRTLAWAIAVESVLLNERLNEDLHESAATKRCPCPPDAHLSFYGPNPTPDARQAFVDYVNCRWPVHVFALDPVTQDENLGDVFSRRREMQLALSLAFVTGHMSTSSFTRYARRLESDMATIALHRTAAGFVHGDRHFGWRFMPRFQTPPFEGNLTTIFRDQIRGGPSKDDELLQMELEPGLRECVAVVIMPSIVSEVQIDTSSRWFKLTNPKHDEPSVVRTVELSAAIKRMQTCAAQVSDHCEYRDGELERLLARVEQLGASLSLQTLRQQVPIENTLGGFALFSSGQTDLAPRLMGYYGEPGVVPGKENVVYLIGDHFSIHETRVLAGNRDCDFKMLSRRVLQVTLPSGVNTITDEKGEYGVAGGKIVDVHVATPYGVTGHLMVAVAHDAQCPKTSFTWGMPSAYTVYYTVDSKATPPTVKYSSMILPAGGDLYIETPENFVYPNDAYVKLTLIANGQIVATYGDGPTGGTQATGLVFEHNSKMLALRGAGLANANTEFVNKLNALLSAGDKGDLTLEIHGQAIFNANRSVHPIESTVTVQLRKK
jgi:hypothetical protein